MTNMSTHRVQSGAMPTIYGSSFSVEDSGDTAINVAYTNTSALFFVPHRHATLLTSTAENACPAACTAASWHWNQIVQGAEPPSPKPKLYVQAQGRSGREHVRVFLGPEWLCPLFAAHEKRVRPIESEKRSYVVY